MKGWQKKRLIEITTKIGSGATPKGGNNSYKESGISLFRSLNVYDGIFKEKNLAFIDEDQANKLSNVVVKEGDVLLNITGASVARCCAAPAHLLPARVNQHVSIVRPKPDQIDTRFFVYLLISKKYKDALLETGEKAGSTRQALTKAQIQDFEILLPSIAEQKQIVAILDEAFEGIDGAIANTEKNLANARELFESYLNVIFTRKGDDWVEKKLSDLSEVQSGGTPLRHKSEYWGGEIAWYSSGELNDLYTTASQRHITDLGLDKSNAKLFPKGSLLIGMYDTAALKMSILDRDAAFNQAVAGMKPNEKIDLVFILHALNFLKPEVLSLRRGVRQKNLSLKKIKNISVAVPGLEEQRKVVEQLAAISNETQRLEAIYKQKLAALNELKQSILQKAFSGELTTDTATQASNLVQEVAAA